MDIEKWPDFDIENFNFGYQELLFDIQNYWTNAVLASHAKQPAGHVKNRDDFIWYGWRWRNISENQMHIRYWNDLHTDWWLHWIDLIRKSHNAPVIYPTTHHSEQKSANFCSEWGIVGFVRLIYCNDFLTTLANSRSSSTSTYGNWNWKYQRTAKGVLKESGSLLNIKTIFPGMEIFIIKITRSWDPIMLRRRLHIEAVPRNLLNKICNPDEFVANIS